MTARRSLAILLLAAGAILPVLPAEGADGVAPAVAAETTGAVGDNAEQYCRAIASVAADARYARQAEAIAAMQKELDDRIAKLDAKRAEVEEWVKRRQEMLDKADAAVVAIYSQMRPDAASKQIAVMDPEAAAAILAKLSPRTASAILNEMDAGIAAALTDVMAGLSSLKGGGEQG
ncbi:MotE family protein [Enterovirga sp.]|uniref:MotE family protein n=1 Tax=Enterovirga sp. TaxID=2026350 RepID=UPI002BD48891|nr:MotE family protein [Enterovirga sp.]HMO30750.1 MotE family protein [Enterovirga sp.]